MEGDWFYTKPVCDVLYMEDGSVMVIERTTLPDVLRNEDGSVIDA